MKRLLLVLAVTACGGGAPKPAPVPVVEDTKPEPPPEPAKPPEPPKPPEPKALDVSVGATTATAKLVAAGKGKRAKLLLAPKAGDKQTIEVAMDFSATAGAKDAPKSQVIPTIVLTGDVEVKTADSGGAAYSFVVAGIDARDVPGASIHSEQIKPVIAALAGLHIDGTVTPNGTAGAINLHLMTADPMAQSALELVRLALPGWPVLPTEPIGVGAKWAVKSTARVADKLEVSLETTYELTAHTGASWTVKGTTKVTGADQAMEGGKISGISGTGTIEATITDGALYPAYKSTLETKFTATEPSKGSSETSSATPAKSESYDLVIGGAVTIK